MREPSETPIKIPAGAKLGFPRSSRILRPAEFRATYDHGLRISGPLFVAFCRKRTKGEPGGACDIAHVESGIPGSNMFGSNMLGSNMQGPRLGLTVPRAIGGAVVRNRIKRRLRAAFRLHRNEFGPQWDIVLNPRRAALDASFPAIERALGRVIEKCGP